MSKPGTRFFIGPLTPAQQRRRERSRQHWRAIDEIMYVRNVSFTDAVYIHKNRAYESAEALYRENRYAGDYP